MKKHLRIFSMVLFPGVTYGQRKPNSNNMPSAQKEMNASMNEIQKTMDEMSPEEKDESAGYIFIGCGNINIARFRQLK